MQNTVKDLVIHLIAKDQRGIDKEDIIKKEQSFYKGLSKFLSVICEHDLGGQIKASKLVNENFKELCDFFDEMIRLMSLETLKDWVKIKDYTDLYSIDKKNSRDQIYFYKRIRKLVYDIYIQSINFEVDKRLMKNHKSMKEIYHKMDMESMFDNIIKSELNSQEEEEQESGDIKKIETIQSLRKRLNDLKKEESRISGRTNIMNCIEKIVEILEILIVRMEEEGKEKEKYYSDIIKERSEYMRKYTEIRLRLEHRGFSLFEKRFRENLKEGLERNKNLFIYELRYEGELSYQKDENEIEIKQLYERMKETMYRDIANIIFETKEAYLGENSEK